MPARNSRKQYLSDGYYHIYNRGVEKRTIFLDQQDYGVFLSYLKQYLLVKETKLLYEQLANPTVAWIEKDKVLKLLRLNNFADEITLLAYCLMPNHFHFLVKQKSAETIDLFMNSLGTRYTMYFNKKYKRVGKLYQGVYKAVLVSSDEQLLHLSRYIHQQSFLLQGVALQKLQPSSYLEYLGKRKTDWVKPGEILAFFSKKNANLSYKAFIEEKEDLSFINNVIFEE